MTNATGKVTLMRIITGVTGAIIALGGVTAPIFSHDMTTIAVHHLLHAGMAIGAGLLALSLALPRNERERSFWIWPAVVAPAIGILLMWPSEYAYLMTHRWLHLLDHLSIALVTLLAVYAAQAYVRGLGWFMLVLVVAMDAACAGGYGVSPGPSFLLNMKQNLTQLYGILIHLVTGPEKPVSRRSPTRRPSNAPLPSISCWCCQFIKGIINDERRG